MPDPEWGYVLNTVALEKKSARKAASALRKQLHRTRLGVSAARHFLDSIPLKKGTVVSLYWPIGSEIDVSPLVDPLLDGGCICALPVVEAIAQPLVFRQWHKDDVLEKGVMDIPVPVASAKIVIPDILVVPLLGFDRTGYRLGYGGGFYDRTLAQLRGAGHCLAVGYAYAGQEVENLPTDKFDQPLDWVVTEKEARKFT
ncbi:5-formyltetrahydrofolate cyclo-ligase [Sneathiella aquimaris]|uniref:5-formyltetrahydrofolate cyclo-ligase n=1 Tax=Sneathiella aquimaris TaxID=2599305 RepID=UPI001CA5374D|nr:5-formyltetrahydrofolate cyclo-ligase [Sneathiella aquimaris]